ncbi:MULTISPECIES: hypothetical protein [unclassified Acinetobacter]|uniref:hypothetical protein n=1 Tax=unclassified Acinetobacter TaxID=196816 RepID=UPI0015D0DE2C|nr:MULTISPECIES: hypothetical protein [unclassified Acinetobacter]
MSKSLLVMALGVSLMVSGCQSYPKNPSKPSFFSELVEVNKTVPTELDGVRYELVKYPSKPTKQKAEKAKQSSK